MTRLELLKQDKQLVDCMLNYIKTMPFNIKETIDQHYNKEIAAIEQYGGRNPEAGEDNHG